MEQDCPEYPGQCQCRLHRQSVGHGLAKVRPHDSSPGQGTQAEGGGSVIVPRLNLISVKFQVQCLQWHPYEPELLVTGAFDRYRSYVHGYSAAKTELLHLSVHRTVRLFNCKTPEVG